MTFIKNAKKNDISQSCFKIKKERFFGLAN
jgi:hypothetical protein